MTGNAEGNARPRRVIPTTPEQQARVEEALTEMQGCADRDPRYESEMDALDIIGFDRWCVKNNLGYAHVEGLEVVCTRIRANGYPSIATAVESIWRATHNDGRD